MNRNDATRIINVIDDRIRRLTRSLAMVETTWGVVSAAHATTVDVKLYGSTTASTGFRVIGGAVPPVSTVVKVAMDKRTGDRWVMEPISAVGSTGGTGTTLAHDDLTGVTNNQHHAQLHQAAHNQGGGDALKLDDLATPDDNTDLNVSTSRHGLVPKVAGSDGDVLKKSGTGAAWGAPAQTGHTIKEDGTPLTQRTGLNFRTGFDLADDSANDQTNVDIDLLELSAFTNHHARHEENGADELFVENLGTAEMDTTKVYVPDGAGGVTTVALSSLAAGSSSIATSSADVTTTSSLQDITSASLSLATGTWIVAGIFDVLVNNSNNDRLFEAHLDSGGTDQTQIGDLAAAGLVNVRTPVIQFWRLVLGATTTVKLRAKHSGGTTGDFTVKQSTRIVAFEAGPSTNPVFGISFVIDGSGGAITTGVKGDLQIPFAATINEWSILCDQSGSIVVDIWKDTYANYPPTVADSITASAKPTVSSATKGTSSTLTGWTTSITAGDTLRFNVDSATTVTRVTLTLKVARA